MDTVSPTLTATRFTVPPTLKLRLDSSDARAVPENTRFLKPSVVWTT